MERFRREEKFSVPDMGALRRDLIETADSEQAAADIKVFLGDRGYGADPEAIKELASRARSMKPEDFKQALEEIALQH